jgi:hypothetical protein
MFDLTAGGPAARRPGAAIGEPPAAAVIVDVSRIDTFATPIEDAHSADSIPIAQTVIVDVDGRGPVPKATTAGG